MGRVWMSDCVIAVKGTLTTLTLSELKAFTAQPVSGYPILDSEYT